jgi:hypothetical protein
LTIKFTRCTRAAATSFKLLAGRTDHTAQFYGAIYLLIARPSDCSDHVHQQAALIKLFTFAL